MSRSDRSYSSEKQYATLEQRVKHIPEATIRKKWKKLPCLSHTATREAILAAKEQSRARNGRRATHSTVENCVQDISTRLSERLTRIPFPPATDETHFDHEANLRSIRKTEEQLNANIHSISLLKAQIAKEEELLRQDEAESDHLGQSLRSRDAYRKDQNRSLHPVARNLGQSSSAPNFPAVQAERSIEHDFIFRDLLDDKEFQPVLEQLHSHLESMSQNIAPLMEVKETVSATKVHCQKYAGIHLDEEQYNGVFG